MKRVIFLLLVNLFYCVAFAQDLKVDSLISDTEDIMEEKALLINGEVFSKTLERYKIYPTGNMYNFLKLDTRTGLIWRIQWNHKDDKRFDAFVNKDYLVGFYDEQINGRFEIYPTENIYTFLLLDKINGLVWQCQWGFERNENWIKMIY